MTITAVHDTQIVLIGGDELGYRYIDWNFSPVVKKELSKRASNGSTINIAEIPSDNQEYMPYPKAQC